jgi:hypothetical protein
VWVQLEWKTAQVRENVEYLAELQVLRTAILLLSAQL